MIRAEDIKTLRAETGASISEVRKALLESGGDIDKAHHWLERSLGERGAKKSERATGAGVVDSYLHPDRKIGVLVVLLCETDFVARTDEFKALAHDVALHVAAMNPLYIRREDAPEDVMNAERRLIEEGIKEVSKPKDIIEQIIQGRLDKHFGDIALLSQQFVKNPDKTVGEVLAEAAGKFGENVKVYKFIRFSL